MKSTTYRIKINAHLDLPRLVTQLEQLVLGPPLGRLGALLVKLANVVEIVDVVAIGLFARTAFAGGRDPDAVDADCFEAREGFAETFPVGLVGGDVPFESLEEAAVVGRGFLAVCIGG